MLDVLPVRSWLSLGGRVALLGDAVHAMHSGPGQGARMAFEVSACVWCRRGGGEGMCVCVCVGVVARGLAGEFKGRGKNAGQWVQKLMGKENRVKMLWQ
jgi:hypothetical protein